MFDNVDYSFKDFIYELYFHIKSPRGFIFILFFRICTIFLKYKIPFIFIVPFVFFHKLINNFFLGIDIPYNAKISGGLRLYHPIGIVIHADFLIHRNLSLRQNTTIGSIGKKDQVISVIYDNVDIGANSVIIGDDITIGKNVKIGAGTVVNKSVSDNSVVVGKGFNYVSR